ncbi:PREDICTED: 26S proteasome regulatory subunit RPN13-like [Populus euphratica]|uniref:26S proteasome regulatory subunit RPN13-like n=1 Tax=Populus euphratica TaxID=75702 RepID=A0AAJ6TUP8_POPEU|nr:PREDICTED: 26S proteasome regulatory subunit RPN13-like [Populus euphratica]
MKLYKGSMRKMGSSSVEDIPAMQDRIIFSKEVIFEKVNRALGRVYILKFNTNDQESFIWMQAKSQNLKMIHNCVTLSTIILIVHLVFEDMLKDNISSRIGNLVVPNLGAEVMSDVTSSSGPVKLEDLQ